jgi:hypothetical protein
MPTKEGLTKLHDTAACQRRRALQLKQFPFCAECLRGGAVTPATCVDHVERWRAGRAHDINRFLLEPVASRELFVTTGRLPPGAWAMVRQGTNQNLGNQADDVRFRG